MLDRYQRRTTRLAGQAGQVARRLAGRAGAGLLTALGVLGTRPERPVCPVPAPDAVRRMSAHSRNSLAAAMLDRLLHRSVVFNIDGESYRMRTHQARAEKLTRGARPAPGT